MDDWLLTQVKPNADHIAKRNLERHGFVTFQPKEWHKAACDRDDIIQREPCFGKGADVEVSFGYSRNHVGKVERLSPGERPMVLLDFMGKQSKVTLPSRRLRVARSLWG